MEAFRQVVLDPRGEAGSGRVQATSQPDRRRSLPGAVTSPPSMVGAKRPPRLWGCFKCWGAREWHGLSPRSFFVIIIDMF